MSHPWLQLLPTTKVAQWMPGLHHQNINKPHPQQFNHAQSESLLVMELTVSVDNELVHASWSQRGPHGVYYGLTGIDVANDLRLALTGVSSFL